MDVELTCKQANAVSHYTGPAIVIAGPGSGKTRVLTERVRFLIEEKNTDPENILVTTEENMLTHDMQRILEGYGAYVSLLEKEKLMDFAFLQTMAFRLLRDNSEILGQVQERFPKLQRFPSEAEGSSDRRKMHPSASLRARW